jgi:hypothetical protein
VDDADGRERGDGRGLPEADPHPGVHMRKAVQCPSAERHSDPLFGAQPEDRHSHKLRQCMRLAWLVTVGAQQLTQTGELFGTADGT